MAFSFVGQATNAVFVILVTERFELGSLGFGTLVLIVVASMINGLSDPAWNVVTNTVHQRLVPDEVFGRMMTAYLFIAWSMNPLLVRY